MNDINIVTNNDVEIIALLSYLRDEGYQFYTRGSFFKTYPIPEQFCIGDLTEGASNGCIFMLWQNNGKKLVRLKSINRPEFIYWSSWLDKVKQSCSENDDKFFDNPSQFFEDNAKRLEEVDLNWQYPSNPDYMDDFVIINGEMHPSELTISSCWPDSLCRRVKIDGIYYYFS